MRLLNQSVIPGMSYLRVLSWKMEFPVVEDMPLRLVLVRYLYNESI